MNSRDLELKTLEDLIANMDSRMGGRAMAQSPMGSMTAKPTMADAAGMGEDEMTRRLRAAMGQ